jgi:toxin ParE1/3/4
MRRFPVEFLAAALDDLKSIYLYIRDKSANASVAAGFIDRIIDRAERIGDVPHGGTPRPDLGAELRLVPFERSAVIIYRVTDTSVEIINIFYGGRDYAALLRNQTSDDDR